MGRAVDGGKGLEVTQGAGGMCTHLPGDGSTECQGTAEAIALAHTCHDPGHRTLMFCQHCLAQGGHPTQCLVATSPNSESCPKAAPDSLMHVFSRPQFPRLLSQGALTFPELLRGQSVGKSSATRPRPKTRRVHCASPVSWALATLWRPNNVCL